TKEASTLGTISYMSPEQFQGVPVDHRADIWAVGVVLYEMLTGVQPFQGDYEQAVMYSVCNEEPAPILDHHKDVPSDLEKIVNRTLEKKPDSRFKDANELLTELSRFRESGPELDDSVQRDAETKHTKSRPWWNTRITLAFASFITVIILMFYYFPSIRNQATSPAWQIKPLTSSVIYEGAPTWSPDGSLIAYHSIVGNSDIYMMSRGGGKPIQLTDNPADELNPRWSPDGSKIAYVSDRGSGATVFSVPPSGGAERKL
ncbi:protein kinase, partial [candidate division KSB1 bacterium]|nr:protein kinase [candidate division KSB1 bacterium]NIT69309.1 protein kinase [candidate division KSB1 bacterium]NIU22966.1 protein kinase [candidate division KSB1 bacterium]NIU89199.1 protein kinase [candidate division KSB1 bacterium]NIW16807.1 protein kinase [candidate division KSB1 bacterium]